MDLGEIFCDPRQACDFKSQHLVNRITVSWYSRNWGTVKYSDSQALRPLLSVTQENDLPPAMNTIQEQKIFADGPVLYWVKILLIFVLWRI